MADKQKPTNLLDRALNEQPYTWAEHGLITFTAAAGPFTLEPWFGAAIAVIVAALYVLDEILVDEPAHKAAGNWETPDRQGIPPVIDQDGDAITPCIAAVAVFGLALVVQLNNVEWHHGHGAWAAALVTPGPAIAVLVRKYLRRKRAKTK